MNPLHVALLFEFPTLNGGENSMLAVLDHLPASFRVTALAPPAGPLAEALAARSIPHVPFSVRTSDGSKRDTADLISALTRHLRNLSPDILHSNSLAMCRLTGQLTASAETRRTGHLRDIIRLSRTAAADIASNDALVAVSQATRDFHCQQGIDAARCEVIHNGVDTDRFRLRRSPAHRQLIFPHIPAQASILLNVGQICLRKGQLNLAESVCRLRSAGRDVHLVLAGTRHSAKAESVRYEAAISQIFADRGDEHHLHLLGYRDDIPDLMNAADLLVHTAHQEPFGRTLLEAASCQLPIIATSVGGTPEMLQHKRDVLLVSPDCPDELDQAIVEAINQPDEAVRRATAARERIEASFTIASAAQRLAEFWLRHSGAGSPAE